MSFFSRLFERGKKDTESPPGKPKKTETDDVKRDLGSVEPRRLPIYLLFDVSSSMAGIPIQAVNIGVNLLCDELMNDRRAIEIVNIAVITFDSQAKMVVPMTALTQFKPPILSAGDGTSLGAALRLLNESLDRDICPDTPDQKGDYKPLVFSVIAGMPTGDWEHEVSMLKQKGASVIALGILGLDNGVDVKTLKRITNVVLVIDTSAGESETDQTQQLMDTAWRLIKRDVRGYAKQVYESTAPSQDLYAVISRYFKWVSQSISTASASAVAAGTGEAQAQLPPLPDGIQIVL